MRRFVFKLEGVLEQRRQGERQRQRAVAQIHRQIIQFEHDVNEAANAEKSASLPLRGRLDPGTIAIHIRFSQVMRQKISALRGQLEAARHELIVAQTALIEASKQRKVLEKLQEKQQATWLAAQEKEESAELDDLAQRIARGPNDSAENFPPYAS